MEFQIEYIKNKGEVFKTLDNYNIIYNNQIQNYMPLYDIFFKLNETNFNSINLNKLDNWIIEKESSSLFYVNEKYKKWPCRNKNFIKFSPLLDPTKYITGKYELTSKLFNLPKLNDEEAHKKIKNKYNSAYVDSFFSYLSSKLLKTHDVFNCLEYYGSFLCNQKDYKVNIFDDVDYLAESPFFHKQIDKLFKIDDSFYEELDDNESRTKKKKIIIDARDADINVVNNFDDNMYDDIFLKPENDLTVFNLKQLESSNLDENKWSW